MTCMAEYRAFRPWRGKKNGRLVRPSVEEGNAKLIVQQR